MNASVTTARNRRCEETKCSTSAPKHSVATSNEVRSCKSACRGDPGSPNFERFGRKRKMTTVDVYHVVWFHCPRCERANFIRVVFVRRGDHLTAEPVQPSVCEHCTY